MSLFRGCEETQNENEDEDENELQRREGSGCAAAGEVSIHKLPCDSRARCEDALADINLRETTSSRRREGIRKWETMRESGITSVRGPFANNARATSFSRFLFARLKMKYRIVGRRARSPEKLNARPRELRGGAPRSNFAWIFNVTRCRCRQLNFAVPT